MHSKVQKGGLGWVEATTEADSFTRGLCSVAWTSSEGTQLLLDEPLIVRAMRTSAFGLENSCVGDAQFLCDAEKYAGALLVEQRKTRQDGAGHIDGTHMYSLAIKLSIKEIAGSVHEDNVQSSDIRQSFQKGHLTIAHEARSLFIKCGKHKQIEGILRIHVELPQAQHAAREKVVVQGNDVLVFVNDDNLEQFFWDGFADETLRDQMAPVRRIIRACYS
eukprot:m51a1_g12924 hypothetical protein (219) ;mRNA; f:486-1525